MIGAVGEAAIKKEIALLQYQFPDAVITALDVCREGNVYDIGIDIDHKLYRGQVKTTECCNEKGAMVFKTSRNTTDEDNNVHTELYKKEDIDFFFLYCIQEGWAGVALPEECRTTTKVYLTGQRSATSKMACDLEFNKRMRELVETGHISPLASERRRTQEKTGVYVKPVPVFKEPSTWNEFFLLLTEYNHDWYALADAIHVSVATLERWHKKLCMS